MKRLYHWIIPDGTFHPMVYPIATRPCAGRGCRQRHRDEAAIDYWEDQFQRLGR
jgi:hypothetical protein